MNINQVMDVKQNPRIPPLAPGDTVKVKVRIVEGEKSRIQPFQGVVIRVRHGGAGASFTVRRVTYGIGVERTFPIYSPQVESVDVLRHGKVRRAKLYYLRGLSTKASRIKERRVAGKVLVPEEGQPVEQAQAAEAEAQAQAAAQAQPAASASGGPAAEQPKAEVKEAPQAQAAEQTPQAPAPEPPAQEKAKE